MVPPLTRQQKHCQLMRNAKKMKALPDHHQPCPQRPPPIGTVSPDLMVVSGLVSGTGYEEQKRTGNIFNIRTPSSATYYRHQQALIPKVENYVQNQCSKYLERIEENSVMSSDGCWNHPRNGTAATVSMFDQNQGKIVAYNTVEKTTKNHQGTYHGPSNVMESIGTIRNLETITQVVGNKHIYIAHDHDNRTSTLLKNSQLKITENLDPGHACQEFKRKAKSYFEQAAQEIYESSKVVAGAVGKGAVATGKVVGKGVAKTVKTVGKGVSKTGKVVGKGVAKTVKTVGKGVVKTGKVVGKTVGKGVTATANTALVVSKTVVKGVAKGTFNAGKTVVKGSAAITIGGCRAIFSLLIPRLFIFFKYLVHNVQDPDQKEKMWHNCAEHFIGNHRFCIHPQELQKKHAGRPKKNQSVKEKYWEWEQGKKDKAILEYLKCFLIKTTPLVRKTSFHKTQHNESLNSLIAKTRPKNKVFITTNSARASVAVGMRNDHHFTSTLVDKLCPNALSHECYQSLRRSESLQFQHTQKRNNPIERQKKNQLRQQSRATSSNQSPVLGYKQKNVPFPLH